MASKNRPKITVNPEVMMKVLQKHVTGHTAAAGEEVADNLRAKLPSDVGVKVSNFVNQSGRPVSMVTITHPSGLARQAKDGVLSRSAAEAGLDIRRYGD